MSCFPQLRLLGNAEVFVGNLYLIIGMLSTDKMPDGPGNVALSVLDTGIGVPVLNLTFPLSRLVRADQPLSKITCVHLSRVGLLPVWLTPPYANRL